MSPRPSVGQAGSAVLTVILVMVLFSAVAITAAVVVRVEILVADHYKDSVAALFAADAGLDAAVAELRTLPDWTIVVSGMRQSAHAQGPFAGRKAVPGGGSVLVCCGTDSASARLATDTALSPLPARRAVQWRPFLWTAIDALAPRDPASRYFVVVWVANDEGDRAGGASNDTNETVLIRSEAIEPRGARRIVEALLGRHPLAGGLYSGSVTEEERRMRVGILRWREVR
ncbi:MAG: hypothetical protein ACRD1U_08625 [Vicinamibacterales bacterium]